jgi:MFS family permease
LFQVRASAGTENLAGSVRKIRLSAVVMLPACVLFALSGSAPAALAILVMTAGYAALTATELFQGSGGWGMMYALTPPGAQGDYIGVYGMSGAVQQILGPAIGTWLVVRYGTAGWLTLAVMVLLAASLIGLVARWAARMMEQRQGGIPADVALAGLGDSERD